MFPSTLRSATLAALLTLVSVLPASAQFFPGPQQLASSGGPQALAVGDLDANGVTDLVATAGETGRILIHRGRGDGTWGIASGILVGGRPSAIQVGDVDRDGQPDIAYVDEQMGAVGVLFMKGQNQFIYEHQQLPGEDEAAGVALVDLDGDGWLELVAAHRGADLLSVYWNQDGVLQPAEIHQVGDGPSRVVAIPWPAPMPPQLAVVQGGGLSRNVGVYEGEDLLPTALLPTLAPGWVEPIDLGGDPLPDLLCMDREEGRALTYEGQPGGAFLPGRQWPVRPGVTVGMQIEPDLYLVTETRDHRVSLYRDGGATVSLAGSWFLGENVDNVLWADATDDGLPELLVPVPNENLILVLRQTVDGLAGHPQVGTADIPQQLELVEPGGGLPTRVSALCIGGDEIALFERGDGLLVPAGSLAVDPSVTRQAWGDVTSDGIADLALLDPGGRVFLHPAVGGQLGGAVVISLGGYLTDLVLTDVVGGSELDLVVADSQLRALRVFEGDGAGGFAAADTLRLDEAPVRLTSVDLDLDGHSDLAALGEASALFLSYGSAEGPLRPDGYPMGEEPRGVDFGRFNEDAFPDIVVSNAGDGSFTVLVSIASRFYGYSTQGQVSGDGAQNVVALRLDANELDDLAVGSPSSRNVSLHLNRGDGEFSVPSRVRCSSLPLDMLSMDLELDGLDDLLVLDSFGDGVVQLRAAGPGALREAPASVAVAPAAAGTRLALAPPFPNPSRGGVRLRLQSPDAEPRLRILDLRGRVVARPALRPLGDGAYESTWWGEDLRGRAVARGRYLVEVRSGGERATRSLLLR